MELISALAIAVAVKATHVVQLCRSSLPDGPSKNAVSAFPNVGADSLSDRFQKAVYCLWPQLPTVLRG